MRDLYLNPIVGFQIIWWKSHRMIFLNPSCADTISHIYFFICRQLAKFPDSCLVN